MVLVNIGPSSSRLGNVGWRSMPGFSIGVVVPGRDEYGGRVLWVVCRDSGGFLSISSTEGNVGTKGRDLASSPAIAGFVGFRSCKTTPFAKALFTLRLTIRSSRVLILRRQYRFKDPSSLGI